MQQHVEKQEACNRRNTMLAGFLGLDAGCL